MAAVGVLYNAGSANEHPRHTGLAHLFEHLMFGGSAHAPNYDTILTAAGGISNAHTAQDYTYYYQKTPVQNIAIAIALEADRMAAPNLTPKNIEIQRSVVTEEYKQQCLNQPYGDTWHHLLPALFPNHPYAWPVIGRNPQHIQQLTHRDINQWWQQHYHPANAILTIDGNITHDQAFELAHRYFAHIPPRNNNPADIPSIPAPRTTTIHATGNVPATTVTAAWTLPGQDSIQTAAADAITDILAQGQAAYLRQTLLNQPNTPYTQTDAAIIPWRHVTILLLTATLRNNTTNPQQHLDTLIETARHTYTRNLADNQNLQRLKNLHTADYTFSTLDPLNRAAQHAHATLRHTTPEHQLNQILSLTPQQVNQHALQILHRQPATLIYQPNNPAPRHVI